MPDIEKLAMEIANAALATHGNTKGPYAGFMVIGETELGDLITRHLTAWAKERDESVIFHLRQAHEAAFHIGTQFARRNTRQHIEDALRELGEGGSGD